jgi:hypothetical protein
VPKILKVLLKLRNIGYAKSTLYGKTRDILYVKTLLGHKPINNTRKYIQYSNMLETKSDEWTCKVARTIEEASKLVESSFEYVTEMDGVKLLKKGNNTNKGRIKEVFS